MKIRINRINKIEQISLFFLIIMGIVSNYIGLSNLWNLLLVIVFVSLICFSKRFQHSFLSMWNCLVGIVLITIFVVINIIVTNSGFVYLADNLFKLYKTIIVAIIIVTIAHQNESIFETLLIKSFKLFNIIWIINLLVLTIQISGIPLFIKTSWMISNPYYEDNCAGLFGAGGTHILAFYSIFMLIYNLYYGDFVKPSKKLQIYNCSTAIWMMILSTQNDNNAIFLLYIIFIILYYYKKSQTNNAGLISKIQKRLSYIIVLLIFAIIIVQIPSINKFINEVFLEKFVGMLDINNNNLNGSTERIAIAYYALKNGFGWKFGLGIGANSWVSDSFYGFMHFGISSIGSMVFLCGIWFYICISLFYTNLFSSISNKNRSGGIYKIVIFTYLIIISVFTTIYTFSLCMIWICFIFGILGVVDKRICETI